MSIPQARANKILDAQHGVAPLPAITAPVRTRLMTANGTATTNGTEVAPGGGYTGGASAPATSWAGAVNGSSATSGALSITNYPRAESVVGIEEWDSSPERLEFGALTQTKTMAAGDTLSFATGAITSAMA